MDLIKSNTIYKHYYSDQCTCVKLNESRNCACCTICDNCRAGICIEKRFLFINEYCLCCIARKECVQKKVTEKETLVHTEGAGVKKSPFFSSSKRGHILMGGGVKIFSWMGS